jgi:hypothetical protein
MQGNEWNTLTMYNRHQDNHLDGRVHDMLISANINGIRIYLPQDTVNDLVNFGLDFARHGKKMLTIISGLKPPEDVTRVFLRDLVLDVDLRRLEVELRHIELPENQFFLRLNSLRLYRKEPTGETSAGPKQMVASLSDLKFSTVLNRYGRQVEEHVLEPLSLNVSLTYVAELPLPNEDFHGRMEIQGNIPLFFIVVSSHQFAALFDFGRSWSHVIGSIMAKEEIKAMVSSNVTAIKGTSSD